MKASRQIDKPDYKTVEYFLTARKIVLQITYDIYMIAKNLVVTITDNI